MAIKILQDSYSEDAVLTTSYADDYTIRGNHFLINKIETIAKETTKTFLVDQSGITEGNQIILDPFIFSANGADVQINIYEDTDYTGGTPITNIMNISRVSDITPEVVFKAEPTGSDKGTLIREHIAFSTGLGVNVTAGIRTGIAITVIDPTVNYLVEIINADTVNSAISEYNISWFEI